MSEQKHTPEPWPNFKTVAKQISHYSFPTASLPESNYNRAKACVDAMAGIENPAAFMEAVENVLLKAVSCGLTSVNTDAIDGLYKAIEQLEAAKGTAKGTAK